ncbi:sulfatase family protein [Occallatibacter riparius]|uniref:Sulfatase-like hydrolase/transferase n=1 Tax=Occallatibacter riparius TaxID=1002689 RepID=A0A9J7BJ27_9BACT|nr:sulfatase-like hydrolase/transferase [Occallatibacter riparius]UWZ82824.1 sulfatase-like hydrolase/transferase [Occallatibacter riparius]
MSINRRQLRIASLLISVGLIAIASAVVWNSWLAQQRVPVIAATKPNIIVILADDLGYADISAYKIDRFHTPNIDRIGLQGVRFTDGYATAPVCGPSRASLMTGRYQERFGFEFNPESTEATLGQGPGLAVGEITIAQLLRSAGYHTGLIGKWHLGSQDQFYPTNRGFDEFVGFLPGQTAYMDPKQPGLHASVGSIGDAALTSRTQPTIEDADQERRMNKVAGLFVRRPTNEIIEGPDRHVIHNESEYLTDYFGKRATEYIQHNAKSGKPYFLYLAFNAVHAPHMVTSQYYDRFPQIQDHQMRVYAAMVAALDDNVGRVLDAVDATGQANNTIIYFASDNGCAAYFPGLCSCTPLRGGKLSHFEGGTRVPFMMRWAGHIHSGSVYRDVVSLLDVLPTSVNAAGGTLPADRIYDGVDLMPYLMGRKTGSPHDMLAWRRLPLFSIRQGDWKLWESVDDKTGKYGEYKLLFNVKEDLDETTNLADKYPQRVRQLEGLAHQWAKEMTDPKWPTRKTVTYNVCGTPFTLPI